MMTVVTRNNEDLNFQFLLKDIADIENLKCNIDMFERIVDEQFLIETV